MWVEIQTRFTFDDIHRVTTRYQTALPNPTCACERVAFSTIAEVVVLWSICILTLVEADMLSAADRQPLTSLLTAEQQQRVLAHRMSHAMHWYSVHVAA